MNDEPPHPYFSPLADDRLERLAIFLHLRWQQHEAIVAEWTNRTPMAWSDLPPDVQRGYRALAVAADEWAYRFVPKIQDGA